MLNLSKPEIEYPISPNVLIDYIKTTSVYPVYWGSNFISFSIEPYLGKGSELPSDDKTAQIYTDKSVDEKSVELLLNKLNLSITAFEEYLNSL